MNAENIRRVIEGIRSSAVPGLGFNMEAFLNDAGDSDNTDRSMASEDTSGHNCGTTACGAGWAVAVFDGLDEAKRLESQGGMSDNGVFLRASEIMGLTTYEAKHLFLLHTSGSETPEDFIAACEHLIEHGEVRWPTLEGTVEGDEGDE